MQRRKELALEAEVKRREQEELEISARQEAEMKAAKARAEKEAYDKVSLLHSETMHGLFAQSLNLQGMREFRLAAIRYVSAISESSRSCKN